MFCILKRNYSSRFGGALHLCPDLHCIPICSTKMRWSLSFLSREYARNIRSMDAPWCLDVQSAKYWPLQKTQITAKIVKAQEYIMSTWAFLLLVLLSIWLINFIISIIGRSSETSRWHSISNFWNLLWNSQRQHIWEKMVLTSNQLFPTL